MAFYAFLPEPPLPRTEFKETEPTKSEELKTGEAGDPRVFEQAMVNVLTRFPEAYRAVMEEMRRLDDEGKGKRSP